MRSLSVQVERVLDNAESEGRAQESRKQVPLCEMANKQRPTGRPAEAKSTPKDSLVVGHGGGKGACRALKSRLQWLGTLPLPFERGIRVRAARTVWLAPVPHVGLLTK